MSMRAATMDPMIATDYEGYNPEPGYFFRKLVLLVLLVAAVGLWTVLLFKNQTGFPVVLATIFTDLCLGMIAGLGSRVVLHNSGLFVQSLIALGLTIFGMILVGPLSDWVLGIGPIVLQPQAAKQLSHLTFSVDIFDQILALKIDLGELFDLHEMNWADPIHLLGSLFMTLMTLYAWRPATLMASQSVEVESLPSMPAAHSPRPHIRTNPGSNGSSRIQLPGGLFARMRTGSSTGLGSRSGSRIKPMVFREPKAVVEARARAKRRRSQGNSHIQFALVEEHRCPYCLDLVTRNDARGVKECEVCHTLHHADCWAITGVCQVPHLNT